MPTRTFTPDQLEQIGIPYDLGDFDGAATELHREQTDTRRWASVHWLVFRAPDDGKAYGVTYQRPLTEHQECDIWFDDAEITATEMEPREVTVTRWMPAEDTPTT
ncbi:hypothetical protein [Streptomyces malaysiensis]|uniref:hypothetical protein n=1 Tax=Streptomyces malaysiensis TaxID=92644 RepID=UPI0011CD567B|nr:hypothetical protein [Streptomyces malaysiensis]